MYSQERTGVLVEGPRQHRGQEGVGNPEDGQKGDTVAVGVRPGQGRSG